MGGALHFGPVDYQIITLRVLIIQYIAYIDRNIAFVSI